MNKAQIESIYPRYSKEFLEIILNEFFEDVDDHLNRTGRESWDLSSMFEIESRPDFDFSDKSVIASSLFFKDNSIGGQRVACDEDGKITHDEMNKSHDIYAARTDRINKSFMENYVNGMLDWDVGDNEHVIYLANDLELLKPIFEEHGRHVFLMKHNSIKHCPGAMWRYLAMNLDCKSVYFADTSETVKIHVLNKNKEALDKYPNCNLVRSLPITHNTPNPLLKNYPTIPGDQFSVRPSGIHFSARDTMLGYVILNIMCERSVTNFSFEPIHDRVGMAPASFSKMEERKNFNPYPIERVQFKAFPHYAFDEMWLKEFLYHEFKDGSMATIMTNFSEDDYIQSLDIRRQRDVGNILVEP